MKSNLSDLLARAATLMALAISLAHESRAYAQDDGPPGGQAVIIHVVQPGESLDSIAERYATTPEAILLANGLTSPAEVTVGQRLIIPSASPTVQRTPITVGMGDTLSALAARYGVSVEALAQTNRLVNPNQLIAGQTLVIPAGSGASPTRLNTVIRLNGAETVWHIALRNRSNVIALMLANRIVDPVLVVPGQILTLPGADRSDLFLRAPWVTMTIHPLPLETGRSGSLRVETTLPGTLHVTFMGADLNVNSEDTAHVAVFSVNRWTAPGLYPITLDFRDGAGTSHTFSRQVMVVGGGYTQEVIRLSAEDAAVLSDTQAVEEESAYIARLMSGYTATRRWDGLFQLPASGVMSSAFGTARTYLGAGYDSFHTGADFVAPVGTPIYAPAGGVVVDTGMLTVRGYFTVIDHGWGVYTGYWHQSSILVQPGDVVVAGQQIGTVGNTGLSTAAHVHWEMWVAGNQVDPLQWAREVFP